MSRRIPWVEKYRPRKLSEFVDQREAIQQLIAWLKQWERGIPEKRAVLLYGPPGTGKTTLAHLLAREFGYELIEMNASDVRRASEIRRVIGRALHYASLFGAKGRIFFLDEIDGMSGTEDRGGLAEIIEFIKETPFPVILAANDPWDPKFKPLRDLCLMIRLKRLRPQDIVKILERICEREGIKVEPAVLRHIAERSEGDVRSAINDLQAIAEGKKVVTEEDLFVLGKRYREYDAFETLKRLFSAKYAEQAKAVLSQSMLDYEQLLLWINENLPYQYKDPEELAKAYEALAKADVYRGRIIRTQDWSLLSYVIDLMTAGVAMARKHPYRFVKYQFPQRLLLMARTKEVRQLRERILERIARRMHMSKRAANVEVLPFLTVIFKANPKMAAGIARWLDLSEDMIKLIAGPEAAKRVILELQRASSGRRR